MKKVCPGQAFRMSATDFNTVVDAAEAHRLRSLGRGGRHAPRDTRPGIITIRNQSGNAQDQFAVLVLDDVVFGPSDNLAEFLHRPTYEAVAPAADGAGKFVVLQEPVAAGALGKALAFGLAPVRVDVSDEDHEYAQTVEGETGCLGSAESGDARILWKESGTGEKWAIVYFPASAAATAPEPTALRLDGTPLTKTDDGATPVHEVDLNEALRIINVGGTYRLALNLSTLYVVDPATGHYGALSSVLRLLSGNVLALRTDANFSDGTNTAALKLKYDSSGAKHRADGAYPT